MEAVGGTPAHSTGTGPSGAGVSSHTPRMPVQPTSGRGRSGESGACRRSAGPCGSGWSSGGGRGGAGAGGSTTT